MRGEGAGLQLGALTSSMEMRPCWVELEAIMTVMQVVGRCKLELLHDVEMGRGNWCACKEGRIKLESHGQQQCLACGAGKQKTTVGP